MGRAGRQPPRADQPARRAAWAGLQPQVALDPRGRFIVAWTVPRDCDGGARVYAQMFDHRGRTVGTYRQVFDAAGRRVGSAQLEPNRDEP